MAIDPNFFLRRFVQLRGAWRDRHTNDFFTHFSLTFSLPEMWWHVHNVFWSLFPFSPWIVLYGQTNFSFVETKPKWSCELQQARSPFFLNLPVDQYKENPRKRWEQHRGENRYSRLRLRLFRAGFVRVHVSSCMHVLEAFAREKIERTVRRRVMPTSGGGWASDRTVFELELSCAGFWPHHYLHVGPGR